MSILANQIATAHFQKFAEKNSLTLSVNPSVVINLIMASPVTLWRFTDRKIGDEQQCLECQNRASLPVAGWQIASVSKTTHRVNEK